MAELKLIQKALFDPYDQSLWFYHQSLMAVFDPATADKTMASNLSNEERLEYVNQEREFVEELLEDTDDCKWIYQALIELTSLEVKLRNSTFSSEQVDAIRGWLDRLKSLDPLRIGRWNDFEQALA